MRNPFRLPLLMLKARRPSLIHDMPLVCDRFWLRHNYAAMTFFGVIVAGNDETAREMADKTSTLRRHEMIHLYQARNTHDSWLCFYGLYVWYYLCTLPMNRKLRNAAYILNPFEMEAYLHMNEHDYLKQETCGNEWRVFARMKPSERLAQYRCLF